MTNTHQFSGLWAVILGGSSGFGYASVNKLANHGMNVALLYRETARAEKTLTQSLNTIAITTGVKIMPYNVNALDEAGRSAFINAFATVAGKKSVRVLLHSIARGNLKPLVADGGSEDNGQVLTAEDIQLTSYAMGTSLLDWARALLKEDFFDSDARIIGLTSEGAHKYWESYAAVSIAKASLESLAKYMAVELGKYGVKTNIIQAGITETPSMKRIPGSEKLIEVGAVRNPLGRMTKPEDVANAVYLLCTEEAQWINGALIHVDGGEHCR